MRLQLTRLVGAKRQKVSTDNFLKITVAFIVKIKDKELSRAERYIMFESDEEFSVEAERELWEGYEAWVEEQAERDSYERGLWM